ncbi:MAG: lysophospholipase [Nanoarchaeota archaeon]|nr:lysophospholipase [Nanoarchaeota archaeon]
MKEYRDNLKDVLGLEFILHGEQVSKHFGTQYFKTEDNEYLSYSRLGKPESKNILIYLNGLESHSGWFCEVANELLSGDVVTYGLDRRGSGLNSKIIGNYQSWVDDVDNAVNIAKTENPGAKVHLTSLCFGAKIASAYAIQNPDKVDSLIYLSPGFSVKVSPSFKEKLKIGRARFFGSRERIPSPIKRDTMFTSSRKYLEFLQKDKLRSHDLDAKDFWEAKLIDKYVLKNLNKIEIPSLVFLAGKDEIVDNRKTKKILNKFGRKPIIVEYPNSEHTIFFGEDKSKLTLDILTFIKNR